MSRSNNNHSYRIGSSTWLLKETKGATLIDKSVLTSLKGVYIGTRILMRLLLGRKRRDRLYIDNRINFSDFLYNSINLLHLDNSLLLLFDVPEYNYKFYSRITRKVENFLIHDVYGSMTSHEPEILQWFSPKEGDIIIDVGAAFGFYTLLSSKKAGPTGKIIAIEAQPDSFEMLNRNIKLNKLSNVITLKYAAYSSPAKLKLYSNYSLMQERVNRNSPKFEEVEANTLDFLLSQFAQLTEVDWIKIDVEGAELEVLKGAHNILSNSKNIKMLIEVHDNDNYESIKKLLYSYGFKIEIEKNYAEGNRHLIMKKGNHYF